MHSAHQSTAHSRSNATCGQQQGLPDTAHAAPLPFDTAADARTAAPDVTPRRAMRRAELAQARQPHTPAWPPLSAAAARPQAPSAWCGSARAGCSCHEAGGDGEGGHAGDGHASVRDLCVWAGSTRHTHACQRHTCLEDARASNAAEARTARGPPPCEVQPPSHRSHTRNTSTHKPTRTPNPHTWHVPATPIHTHVPAHLRRLQGRKHGVVRGCGQRLGGEGQALVLGVRRQGRLVGVLQDRKLRALSDVE
jgi:hypothetical protein